MTSPLVRYNADGTLDAQFGKQEWSSPTSNPTTTRTPARAGVALQPDGKIVVGATGHGPGGQDFVLLRYLGNSQRVPKWW